MSISPYTPAIPAASIEIDQPVADSINAIKETIDLREGRKSALPLEQFVSLQDLIDLGLVTQADINNSL